MSNDIIWSRFVGIVKESSIEYPFEIIYVAYNTCTTVYSIIMCEYACTYTVLCEKSFLEKSASRRKGRLTKSRRSKKKKKKL